MPSSISSSNARIPKTNYIKQWSVTFIIFIIAFTCLEFSHRSHGIIPTAVDSQDLWSVSRAKLDQNNTQNLIITLGASRINIGTDGKLIQNIPGYNYANLAVDGNDGFATLTDIANNSQFNGILLFSFVPNDLNSKNYNGQQIFVDYYHDNYKHLGAKVKTLNQNIATKLQYQSTVMSCPPPAAFNYYLLNIKNYIVTHPDRTRSVYYKTRITNDRLLLAKKIRETPGTKLYNAIKQNPSLLTQIKNNREHHYQTWLTKLKKLKPSIDKIQARGGKVIFVRYPTSGKRQFLNQTYFPREHYWNKITQALKIQTIHFQDIQGSTPFTCPDSSHLNHDEATRFTKLLISELITTQTIKITSAKLTHHQPSSQSN